MKVLLINGSPHEKGCTYTALAEVAGALKKNGIDTDIFHIGKKPVRGCIACGACQSSGKCVFNDDPANQMQERMVGADGIIIGSPVYYAGPNGALCALLDRVFFSDQGKLAFKPAAAVASARLYTRGCQAGCRGLTDHADAGLQHGMAAQKHSERCTAHAGNGAVDTDTFYTIKGDTHEENHFCFHNNTTDRLRLIRLRFIFCG